MPLGRYHLIALVGQGGMADVYLACTRGPSGFRKLLVVKLARFTGEPMLATMFLDEARIAAQLEHPNIVQTYEIAEDGSRHYIVMEFLDGANLAQLRHRSKDAGGIPPRIALTILLQVLDGLEYAHEARAINGRELKVVHRDLSPGNIMVTAQGAVKILDFGIAKAAGSYSSTQTGKFSGKLGYMPPEQLRGDPVDVRDDLFAFGVILAEVALNAKLWGRMSDHQIAGRLANSQIPTLDRGKPIDPELRAICKRTLALERRHRYASAFDLKTDLARYLAGLGGPVSPRELSQFVRTTAADDRAKLQAVIDAQLDKLGAQSWDAVPTITDLPLITHTPSPTGPGDAAATQEIVFEDDPEPRTTAARPASVAAPRMTRRLLALGGPLLVLMVVFIAARSWRARPSTPPPAAVHAATIPPPSAPPAPPPPRLETQSVEASAGTPQAVPQPDDDLAGRSLPPSPSQDGGGKPRPRPSVKSAVAPPRARPKVETAPAPTPTPSKPLLDTDVYAAPSDRRSLDADVLDESSTAPKPTIDRNPWEK